MATDTKLNIEYVSINSIQPYEKNARTHGKADVKSIAESIREFGFKDPIGIWHDTIVEGHGRLLAAKELGMEMVPIIRLDDLTDEQRKAYALAHNKTAELSSWDQELLEEQLKQLSEIDMSLFGFDMSALGFEEGEAQDDGFVAVPPTQAQSGLGDIFKLGGALRYVRRLHGSGDHRKVDARAAGRSSCHRSTLQCGLYRKDQRCAQDRERQER